jgi:multisubunit Na+/H+ antiporter MnhF subunit
MPARHRRPESPGQEKRDEELSVHIFSVSAGLVGVCLTVIGLFRVIFRLKDADSLADNILAVDALGFLLSCGLAYMALRSSEGVRRRRFELLADRVFLVSLGLMAIVGAMIAYEMV